MYDDDWQLCFDMVFVVVGIVGDFYVDVGFDYC